MPTNPNINMAYRGIQLENPLAIAQQGESLRAQQRNNALAEQEVQQMQSPEYQQAQQTKASTERHKAGMEDIKASLPSLTPENWNAFGEYMQKNYGEGGVFMKPYDPATHEKMMQNFGIVKPQEARQMSELDQSRADYLRWQMNGGGKGGQPQGQPQVDASGAPSAPAPNLPVPALKIEQEEKDYVNTAQMISSDMDKYIGQIESGELDLGMFANPVNRARNYAGRSTPQSQNLARLDAGLQKLRNDSLRLNKGPQTDGDADRAWQELLANINDPEVVKARMADIKALNENAARWHMQQANAVRQNFGAQPIYNVNGQQPQGVQSQPSAQTGKVIRYANLERRAAEKFGGNVDAARQAAIAQGYQVIP